MISLARWLSKYVWVVHSVVHCQPICTTFFELTCQIQRMAGSIQGCTFDHLTGWLMELGGGRNNKFSGNVINGSSSLHFDNRGGDGSGCEFVKFDGD